MKKIDLQEMLRERYPAFFEKPQIIQKISLSIMSRILHLSEINKFIEEHPDTYGLNFIDDIFDSINFSFSIPHKDIQKIPSEGRVICVSNHPIGSLDGLALLRAIGDIRPDVKIIANDVLYMIENLRENFIPFNVDTRMGQRRNIEMIGETLDSEQALIIFPAAEVSRLRGIKVMDKKWNKGPIYFAKKFESPILPMHVAAKNSAFFYFFSLLHKDLSRVLLAHELFNKRNKTIKIRIGDPIPAKAFTQNYINDNVQLKLLKKHVYAIGKNKRGVYTTEKNIIHPVDKQLLKRELNNAKLLGITKDEKMIILTDFKESPNILKELARLREVTFRRVGEGTGNKLDIDKYDRYYKQIIVWDDKDLEIVGSYRIGLGDQIMSEIGPEGFYTSSLFGFSDQFKDSVLSKSVELGRSFVQRRYWNTNALHYLWLGIGAFLTHHPHYKVMFGGVSISNSYPEEAKQLIVYYFNKWFGEENKLVSPNNEYKLSDETIAVFDTEFTGKTYKEDYRVLKTKMKDFGMTVPILYKHYSELCDDDGVKFLCFSVDPAFENCIDGLIMVDIDKIKDEKRQRYMDPFAPMVEEVADPVNS